MIDAELYGMLKRALRKRLGWSDHQINRFFVTGDPLDDWIDVDVTFNEPTLEPEDGNHCRRK
tara:strand:+ start:145 stop:330 length:186 start_codon:yes stop_codon:yes gene_type:complete